MTKISRALLSAYDKRGVEAFGQELHRRGAQILSTSGTAKALAAAGVPVVEIAQHTGFPEMLDGRVKTLHPKVHGGILGRRNDPAHVAAMEAHGIPPIDLVCINLYPFRETIARPGVTADEAIEQIDIGGPAMVRSAAKNHEFVLPVIDPGDYAEVLRRLDGGGLDLAFRRMLAGKAFRHTALYDAAIAAWLGALQGERFPATLLLAAEKVQDLRYGENPHQAAALYRDPAARGGLAHADLLNGKPLSYNNIQDAVAAYGAVNDFEAPTAVVVKHANPCGAASASDLVAAFRAAWEGDPVSAFGGILAFNREVTAPLAEAIAEPGRFVEVVIAPSFRPEAVRILAEKPKWGPNVRLLACSTAPPGPEVRSVPGGFLVQDGDGSAAAAADLKVKSKRAPSAAEIADLVFAQRCCKHVKSNAIVLARDARIVGVGAGQMSRVDAARLAVAKAGERAQGAVFASDAFLPFNDALEVALDAGITAAVQPGGSRNDDACIRLADERGLALVFTGTRHFRH
ncbi:MAG: bifunctional phosphoribosylaminoimidazolecarboxamide formyltransferase/IMP cyclohydrolase [Planctomycetaceae bacterium]